MKKNPADDGSAGRCAKDGTAAVTATIAARAATAKQLFISRPVADASVDVASTRRRGQDISIAGSATHTYAITTTKTGVHERQPTTLELSDSYVPRPETAPVRTGYGTIDQHETAATKAT